jgi:hypothetical protein
VSILHFGGGKPNEPGGRMNAVCLPPSLAHDFTSRSKVSYRGVISTERLDEYSSFREAIVMLNDTDRGCFVKAAPRYAGVCSPGERELLKGILLLTNFAQCPTRSRPAKTMIT